MVKMPHQARLKKPKPPRICAEFAETGACEWGEHCRFSHGESNRPVTEDLASAIEVMSLPSTSKQSTESEPLISGNAKSRSSRLNSTGQHSQDGTDESGVVVKKDWMPTKRTRMLTMQPLKSKPHAVQGQNAIEAFYKHYPDFDYIPSNGPSGEFYRLSDSRGWSRFSTEQKEARSMFQTALVELFNERYGTDVSSLRNWLKICVVLNIDPFPSTIEESQEVVMPLHFNLVDMVGPLDEEIQLFPNRHKMHDYTTLNRKYFPSNHPLSGELLKFLLKEH